MYGEGEPSRFPGPQRGPFTPPPGPWGAPPPAGRRRPRHRTVIVLVVAGVLVVAMATVGAVIAVSTRSGQAEPVQAGQCVSTRPAASDTATLAEGTRVDCDSRAAKAKVMRVLGEQDRTKFNVGVDESLPECPDRADGVTVALRRKGDTRYWKVCVRNLHALHPGDPGAGGGELGPGDCVSDTSFGSEQPCTGSDWYGKVVARVAEQKACPLPQTLETAKITNFGGGNTARPIVCIGAGAKIISPGDCIQDPTFAVGNLQKADCSAEDAIAKITARVRTTRQCPAGSGKYLRAKGAFLPITCLRQIRPTFSENLDSLRG